jgi:hypothetical protein
MSEQMDPLYDALAVILENGRRARISAGDYGLLEALKERDISVATSAAILLSNLGQPLAEIVQADSRFPGKEVRLVRGEGGGSGFYPNFIGRALVHRVLESGEPAEAIRWLEKVLSTSTAFGHSITALWGVPVDDRIHLTPEVDIVPIADLPESPQKTWISTSMTDGFNALLVSGLNLEPPRSALVIRKRIDHFVFAPEAPPVEGNNEYLATHELFKEITLALTVSGPRVPIQVAHWFTFEDPDLQLANVLGSIRSQSLIEILPRFAPNYPPLDSIEAPAMVQAYLELRGRTRDVIRVGIQRLNQAQRRHNIGDRAVEFCTAVEALLGDNQKTEMTHKIKSRAARLLGGSIEIRQRNAAILGEAYAVRSSLVHTGRVDEKTKVVHGETLTRAEMVERAINMGIDIVKLIIRRGSIPDWTAFDITEQHP